MEYLWQKIESWLVEKLPGAIQNLGAPATEQELKEIESLLKVSLPEELEKFLKVHNGEQPEEIWLLGNWSLLPSKYIISTWKDELNGAENPVRDDLLPLKSDIYVKPCLWNEKWIPIAYDGAGGYLCLDLDPTSNGVINQVIQTSSDGFCRKLADSLADFFKLYIETLQNNQMIVHENRLEPNSEWWLSKRK